MAEFPANGKNRLEEQLERETAYRNFILDLYHAKPMNGYSWLHGTKSGRMVHVAAVDAPVTRADVKAIASEGWKALGMGKGAEGKRGEEGKENLKKGEDAALKTAAARRAEEREENPKKGEDAALKAAALHSNLKAAVDILGWEFALEVNELAKQVAAESRVDVSFKKIPRGVLDKKAVEQGDVKFFELGGKTRRSNWKRSGSTRKRESTELW